MKLLMKAETMQLIKRNDLIDEFCNSYKSGGLLLGKYNSSDLEGIESLNKAQFWERFGEWAEGLIECGEIIVIDNESELYAFEPHELELKVTKING
mgnify:FL=1